MYSAFASIGLSMLIPAMVLRKNTKEYSYSHPADAGCSFAFSEKKTVRYINEKHRYGYRHPLKRNALLIYMYLHFLDPDENGYVRKIDTEEISEILGCSQRTVINNLSLLDKTGYIMANRLDIPGYFQAFICNYKDIFKKAQQGGRGFLRIGLDFMKALTCFEDVNAIRLAIRSYLSNIEFENKPQLDKEKSLRDIKSQLPEYVTRKKLLHVLSGDLFQKMFKVTTKTRSATIIVLPEYNQKTISEKIVGSCRGQVIDLIDRINKENRPRKNGSSGYQIRLSEKEITDISNIALKVPVPSVLEGLRHFYDLYVAQNLHYASAGALVRAFAYDHAEQGFLTG